MCFVGEKLDRGDEIKTLEWKRRCLECEKLSERRRQRRTEEERFSKSEDMYKKKKKKPNNWKIIENILISLK